MLPSCGQSIPWGERLIARPIGEHINDLTQECVIDYLANGRQYHDHDDADKDQDQGIFYQPLSLFSSQGGVISHLV
jgi:hypothetical protein